jgi:hypothetical protein
MFAAVCRDHVAAALGLPAEQLELSMGMSGDFEQAVSGAGGEGREAGLHSSRQSCKQVGTCGAQGCVNRWSLGWRAGRCE